MSERRRRRSSTLPVRFGILVAGLVVVGLASACGGDSDAAPSSGSDGRKVTVAGDSISVGLGSQLRAAVADADGSAGTVVKVIGESGTGLARPDNFDWPARLRRLAAEFPPDVLVFSVGSNDAQDLTSSTGEVVVTMSEGEAWDAEYSRRLAEVFDAFAPADGAEPSTRVVWVGHVRTADDDVGDTNRRIHRLAARVAADRPWVTVEDLGDLLGTGEDVAERCLLDDGLHLGVDCLDEAAATLAPLVAGGR